MQKSIKYLWCGNIFLGLILAILTGIVFYKKNDIKTHCSISNEEMIDIAIRRTLQDYPPSVDFSEDRRLYKPATPVYYKDVEDFKNKNPNCCEINYKMSPSSYHFEKGYGNYFNVVLNYDVFYLDAQDNLIVKPTYSSQYISTCGVAGTFNRD